MSLRLRVLRWSVGAACAVALAVVLCCTGAALAAGAAPVADDTGLAAPLIPVRVVRKLEHDTRAFTQGLFFHRGRLFETTGRYGQSRLMELDPDTGRELRVRYLPAAYFGEGAVAAHGRILWLTWKGEAGFALDPDSFETVGDFEYSGEGWGLTFDGTHLVMSDGSATLTLRDPDSFEPVGSIEVADTGRPVDRLNELEWVDGLVYANVWGSARVAVIDPASGAVLRWLDLSPLVPDTGDASAVANGLAWDVKRGCLLVTGKLWPVTYCVVPAP